MSLLFTETLRGSYFLLESPEVTRLCEVAVQFRLHRPHAPGEQFQAELTGHATFDGLCSEAQLQGRVDIQLKRPRVVRYAFDCTANDGRSLTFRGDKHPSLLRPLYSATTLWGTLEHDGKALAMVRLHFDLRRDLVVFLQSLSREES